MIITSTSERIRITRNGETLLDLPACESGVVEIELENVDERKWLVEKFEKYGQQKEHGPE